VNSHPICDILKNSGVLMKYCQEIRCVSIELVSNISESVSDSIIWD
jgi:hypothetical protein